MCATPLSIGLIAPGGIPCTRRRATFAPMRRAELKARLEDLVDHTGRVEDMLAILAGIYRERARHPEYVALRGQMLATAHVLHEASEAVDEIFSR